MQINVKKLYYSLTIKTLFESKEKVIYLSACQPTCSSDAACWHVISYREPRFFLFFEIAYIWIKSLYTKRPCNFCCSSTCVQHVILTLSLLRVTIVGHQFFSHLVWAVRKNMHSYKYSCKIFCNLINFHSNLRLIVNICMAS